jgi:demethylmenaquinone methyltransferase / 2-methoxy-6-polyprenyl-1,4-benzoquinol methylase
VTDGKPADRQRPLQDFFTAVPPHYDLINRIFTLGMDEGWRKKTAQLCLASHPQKVLDLCCGTADLAIRIARLAPAGTQVVGLDFSPTMLEIAQHKAAQAHLKEQINFVHGDVNDLPFPDGYFDSMGIGFAFRNLTYKNPRTQRYLSEIVRVLKPGGEFVIVESSQPPNRLLRKLAHWYVGGLVPALGVLISRNRPPYQYLAESSRNFYTAEELADLLVHAGFSKVTVKKLFFGAAAIHIATK